jgi:hypothetical protein
MNVKIFEAQIVEERVQKFIVQFQLPIAFFFLFVLTMVAAFV